MLKVHDLLLDESNTADAMGETVGSLIATSGKKCLWDTRLGSSLDTVVIHYMSAVEVLPQDPYNTARILRIFCDYGVSSHFLIQRRGTVYRLVPEAMKAWHCGGSIMPDGRTGVNDFSLGIELVATATSGFTTSQYRSLCELCIRLELEHDRQLTYVGHDMIAGPAAVARGLRRDAKVDPGPLFNWECFRSHLDGLRCGHSSLCVQ